jgi:hypothetical protein
VPWLLRAVPRADRAGRLDVAYVAGSWRPVAGAIRALPRPLFERLDL